MAEVLIKAHDNNNARRRGACRAGDPVVVMPDGYGWDGYEGPPNFVVLRFPGLSVEAASVFLTPDTFASGRRKKWRLNFDDLHRGARASLLEPKADITSGGSLRWSELRRAMQRPDGEMPVIEKLSRDESQPARDAGIGESWDDELIREKGPGRRRAK